MDFKSIIMFAVLVTFCVLVFNANGLENQTSTESITTTITSPNTSKSEYRVYLVRQTLDKDLNEAILEAVDEEESQPKEKKRQNNSTTQIYVIAVIGVSPAVIGGFMWVFKNLKRKCVREKAAAKRSKTQESNNANPFLISETPIDQITYKIVDNRADKLNNDSNTLWYNSYKPSYFVKSRRVYSLEVSRKNLDLIEILGEGNFGQVWKARAVQIGKNNKSQTVAVKTNKINTEDKDSEDILKELDIMLQLGSHPNVVKLLGCCTENVPYFLIMEFVSNGKLLSYLRKHRIDKTYYTTTSYNNTKTDSKDKCLSSNDLVLFSYQIAKGMEFICSHGIIHRDLAARNILIDENKTCKVADFGLSRSIRDKDCDQYEQKTGGQMPVRWMSPESLQMGIFSSKSDVWSYGILLWEIVTLGSTPYIGLSAQQVIKYICDKQIIDRPEHCSEQFYELIKMCFTFESQNRLSFTDIKLKLSKLIECQCGYVDLQHFNDNIYYNLNTQPEDEKL